MQSPLTRHNDLTAALPPQYCGSCSYYAVLASYSKVIIHNGMRYDKRFKSTHRTTIADTRGILDLTVPVAKPEHTSGALWSEATVSPHGSWWNIHLTALESAYGRTPFFEYYIDEFAPLFREDVCGMSITDFDAAFDAIIRRLLGITTEVEYLNDTILPEGAEDLTRANFSELTRIVPYYQVRGEKLGFIPNLSIFDLLFNMGPEAQVVLSKSIL